MISPFILRFIKVVQLSFSVIGEITEDDRGLHSSPSCSSLPLTWLSRSAKFISLGCAHVPKLLASGRHDSRLAYIVMQLYGPNISVLRRQQPSHRFSMTTTCALGMQMLRAIREVALSLLALVLIPFFPLKDLCARANKITR